MPRPCRICKLTSHSTAFCYAKPKNRSITRHEVKKLGKYGQKWLQVRAEWFQENPSDFYTCYICGERLTPKETTLDHIKSRSRHPELRFDMSNLAPCCYACNRRKGSRDLEEI